MDINVEPARANSSLRRRAFLAAHRKTECAYLRCLLVDMPESRVGDALLALASAHVGHLIGGQLSIAGILRLDRQLRKHALVAVLNGVVDGQVGVVFFALNEAISARARAGARPMMHRALQWLMRRRSLRLPPWWCHWHGHWGILQVPRSGAASEIGAGRRRR